MDTTSLLVLAVAVVALGAAWFAWRRTGRLNDDQFAQLVGVIVRTQVAEAQSQALQQNSEQFLALAETRLRTETARGEERLKARADEIEKGLETVGTAITKLRDYVESTDKTRGEGVASLAAVTAESRKTMEALGAATGKLTEVLVSGQARGQWGERMAEDILRVAGFVEGVQYRKNTQLDAGSGRPDFTFLLPQTRVLYMDVKFPLAAYLRYLEAASEPDRAVAVHDFLRDARARIREVTNREYIDPAGGTLDYVLLFVPNEQVYGFIHESDPELLDGALRQRVVMCSPFTLFAVLSVIRQAIDNFHLTQRTDEILTVLGGFNQQWTMYKDAVGRVGRGLATTQKAFDTLSGPRTRVLDRHIERVERLRVDAGLPAEVLPAADEALLELGDEELPGDDEDTQRT